MTLYTHWRDVPKAALRWPSNFSPAEIACRGTGKLLVNEAALEKLQAEDPMTFYTHWRDVPKAAWRWANFSPAEIACRGTGKLLVNEAALDKLQALRVRLGKPLIVLSAYRSPEHNRAVGGAKASKHMEGIAFDVAMANHDPEAFQAAARAVGFKGFGFYPRSGFIHIDLGPGGAGVSGSRRGRRRSQKRRSRRGRCWQKAAR